MSPMGSVGLHALLLGDTNRTRAFDRALAKLVRPGDVVADLGAGSGILSLLALKHGASRVYAVEKHPIAELARVLARENGVEDRLVVVRGRAQEVRLPERADVVVGEMLGHAIFDEGLLDVYADARRRHLRPGGRMIPSRVRVMGAPASSSGLRAWDYGVRLDALRSMALHTFWPSGSLRLRGPGRVMARVRLGASRLPLTLGGRWRTSGADGLAIWFEADLAPGVRLSSLRGTHWQPTFFPAPGRLRGEVRARLNFHSDDEVSWQFAGYPAQHSALGDEKALAQRAIGEGDVPRVSRSRREHLSMLAGVDGRRTVGELARGLKGVPYRQAVTRVKTLCLLEGLLW